MNNAPHTPSWRAWWLLCAGLFLLLAFALGSRGLNEPDEGRYANIARTMVVSGDWWEPRMSGYGHYDKPPLIYWTTAAAFRLFGINEWSARAPSLLGALLALTGLGWAAWRLYGPRVAWWAVLVCGTSVQFFILARILTPDMLLAGWCALGIGAWAEARHRGGAWNWWAVSLLFWTLAWWTKATPALVPLAGLVVGLWLTGDGAGRHALRWPLLFPAILVLGSPWYLSMLHTYPELRGFFFGRELAGRMTGHVDGRRGSPFYYLGVSLVAWLPWWPLAAWSAWKIGVARAERTARPILRKLGVEGCIVLVGLVIFSLASSKLPTYTVTLAPWAALLLARAICATWVTDARPWPRAQHGVAIGFAIFAAIGVMLLPRFESSLKVNSSLREVARETQSNGPRVVFADRYWQGLEVYLGPERVRYVAADERLRERKSDLGIPPELFLNPHDDAWRELPANDPLRLNGAQEIWLVHFLKQERSPFADWLKSGQSTRAGDFELVPARVENGVVVKEHSQG